MRYALTRLVQLAVVLLVVSFLTFLLVRFIPGDPFTSILGFPREAATTPEQIAKVERLEAFLDEDKALPVAYADWLTDVVSGDLGFSYVRNTPVSELLSTAIPRTGLLLVYSIVLSLLLAVPLGVLAAYRQGGLADKVINFVGFSVISLPNFVLAVLLVYLFATTLGWLPSTNVRPLSDGLVEHAKSYALPVLSLAIPQSAVFMRVLRTDMIATLQEDFIGVARAKGLPVRRVLFRHALRPSSFTLLTVAGLNVGQLIGGTVIIEFIFNINGMGSQLVGAVLRSDYVLVQSAVLLVAAVFIIINFSVDILYGVLDPRTRHARRSH